MWSEANQLHPLKWFTVRNNKKNPRRHGWLPMQSSIDNTCIVLHARFFLQLPMQSKQYIYCLARPNSISK